MLVDDYDQKFLSFKEKYSNLPGVMQIDEDLFSGTWITLVVDRATFNKKSVPDEYEGLVVHITDAYLSRDSLKKSLDSIAGHVLDTDGQKMISLLNEEADRLSSIISEYEKRHPKV